MASHRRYVRRGSHSPARTAPHRRMDGLLSVTADYSGVQNTCHSEPAGEESHLPHTDAPWSRDPSFLRMTRRSHHALIGSMPVELLPDTICVLPQRLLAPSAMAWIVHEGES